MLHKGYTLLFAVLLSSVVLSIAVSVLNIARKEVLLSSSARESAFAIYVADGAVDCAIYHDGAQQFRGTTQTPVLCGGINRTVLVTNPTGYTRYEFFVSDAVDITSPCARVTVDRYPAAGSVPAKTIIEARGYNLGYNSATGKCDASHPRKVERAFRYSYNQ